MSVSPRSHPNAYIGFSSSLLSSLLLYELGHRLGVHLAAIEQTSIVSLVGTLALLLGRRQ